MDSDDGIRAIKNTLSDKKVLIVLDDVDNVEQLHQLAGSASWFTMGSRIIVTTRDTNVLTVDRGIVKGAIINLLEMELLNSGEALQLFSRHVFANDDPPADFDRLSKEVVSAIGNLPLLLEIIGSQLHENRCEEEWQEMILDLKKIPNDNIMQKLMLSYEALGFRGKQIFLDVACFFIDKEKSNPIYMWEACGFHPDKEMQDLVSKSLVKIVDGKLWMHDYLRDLGREIVWQESAIDPGERSRVWQQKEAVQILRRKEGTKKVEALCLFVDDQLTDECLQSESLECLKNLRFLQCYGLNVSGSFQSNLYNLRWLSWHNFPVNLEINDLNLENLAILDLSRSRICEDWTGWSSIKTGDMLKVLDLTNCENLTRTPNFSKYPSLERLILEGCKELIKIDESIGTVKRLKHFNVKGCDKLQGLPEELGSLDALEEILVKGNGGSFSLPENVGRLKSLVFLDVVQVRITELPQSICELSRLEHLDLSYCSGVEELPSSLGNLTSLVELDISFSMITKLPDSIEKFKALRVLKMKDAPISKLPDTIGELTKLQELQANKTKLASLPKGFESLTDLKILNLSTTYISELPELSQLTSLQELHLKECDNIQELRKLPSSLTILSLTCSPNLKLQDFSNLENLGKMYLDTSRSGEASNSCILRIDLHACSQLELLVLKCRDTQGPPKLPRSLKNLALEYLDTETNFPHLSQLQNLCYLELRNCSMEGSLEQHGFSALRSLSGLSIQQCELIMLSGDWLPQNLESLEIKDCESLAALRYMQRMVNLKRLHLSDCQKLVMVQGLEGLKSLRWLEIISCHSFRFTRCPSILLKNLEHYRNDSSNFPETQESSLLSVHEMWPSPWEESQWMLNRFVFSRDRLQVQEERHRTCSIM